MRLLLTLCATLTCATAAADPIHARVDGAYWHHESNWSFPEKLGDFARVGIPQDLAGSRDAQAWYARGAGHARTVASIDLIAPESVAGEPTEDAARGPLDAAPADIAGLPAGASRAAYLVTRDAARRLIVIYRASAGAWRVRIRIEAPADDVAAALADFDAFARAQRWDALCDDSMASSASCAAAAGAASSP